MSQTPFDGAEALRVGTIDFVSPNEVRIVLDVEAPDVVALHVGAARPFPRVNGYLLVPTDDAYLVVQVEWLTVERSAFPTRKGVRDFGIIDLPYSLRRLSASPVGTLRRGAGQSESFQFDRGSDSLPSVGVATLLPTETQLRAIVESGQSRRVRIGTSPVAADAEVYVDPDRLFGRHLAVLGNTGSGKSCSVAGLIRWSIEAARAASTDGSARARFIILDPNGEYAKAFADNAQGTCARVFTAQPDSESRPLKVPLWFWNSDEWASRYRKMLWIACSTKKAAYPSA